MKFIPLSLMILIVMSFQACKSVDTLYKNGEYRKVIDRLEPKMKKEKVSRSDKTVFINAYNALLDQKTTKLATLLSSTDYQDWEKAKQTINDLQTDRSTYIQLKPIRDVDLDSIQFNETKQTLNKKLYAYYIERYDQFLAAYHVSSIRSNLVEANKIVDKMRKVGGQENELSNMKNECFELGHRSLFVEIINEGFFDFTFDRYFKGNLSFENDEWNTFIKNKNKAQILLVVGARIIDEDVTYRTRTETYSERIIDRYVTKIDTSTNTSYDEPVYINIEAHVEVRDYNFEVEAVAYIEAFEIETNERIFARDFEDNSSENEEVYVGYSGDERAVPRHIRFENFTIQNYDYDDLIEEVFEDLARDINYGMGDVFDSF